MLLWCISEEVRLIWLGGGTYSASTRRGKSRGLAGVAGGGDGLGGEAGEHTVRLGLWLVVERFDGLVELFQVAAILG